MANIIKIILCALLVGGYILWIRGFKKQVHIGGDGVNSSWSDPTYEYVYSMTYGKLYVGLGLSTEDAEIWEWDGEAWFKKGFDIREYPNNPFRSEKEFQYCEGESHDNK